MKLTRTIVALAVIGLLAGCQSTQNEKPESSIASEWSNRPHVDKLEELKAIEPVVILESEEIATASNLPTVRESKSGLTPVFGGTVVEPDKPEIEFERFNQQLRDGVHASYIAESSTYVLDSEAQYEFYAYENETYRSALSRWLSEQGYGVVGWYLSDIASSALDTKITSSFELSTSFEEAVEELISKAKQTDLVVSGISYPQAQVESEFMELRLNADDQEAVVTSTKMPTTIFYVLPGSLRENFVRLGEHYGWKVKPDFYLAKDYRLSFGYPIVSERGNVKVALEQLLAPFSSLRGALVPSVREIYVVAEKE
ncbi:TcpQ domain-containing protein [Vibrio mediterranei]|uniref:TcpQ domain-containing protein n=1 Tax=Vibrio mediterranei TaxID=689 RepID=UPI004068F120